MRATALFLLSCCAAAIAADAPAKPSDADEAVYPAIERFIEVMESVRKRHPDADKVQYDRLVNHALEGMLSSLDPFSSFIHPEMAAAMKAGAPEPFVPSLGITLGLRDDGAYIAAVEPHSPGEKAGLTPGSALLSIDGQATKDLAIETLLGRLQKAAGANTTLKVKATDYPLPKDATLVHRVVETRSLPEARMLENHIGYLRLAQFGAGCAREVETALDDLEDKGMKALVFDLRENPGGQLDETVKLLGLFVPPSTAVVTTQGRGGVVTETLKTPDRQRRKRDYPIAILISRMSASAAELTPGCLQDLKRATIVGEQSFGKGSVQNIIPLGNGTALRLTIATYHTPSGRTPHHVGITPDASVAFTDDDRACFDLQRRRESLSPEDQKRLAAWKDPALAAAVEKLRK